LKNIYESLWKSIKTNLQKRIAIKKLKKNLWITKKPLEEKDLIAQKNKEERLQKNVKNKTMLKNKDTNVHHLNKKQEMGITKQSIAQP